MATSDKLPSFEDIWSGIIPRRPITKDALIALGYTQAPPRKARTAKRIRKPAKGKRK
jgi:hypothetical protein